MARQLTAKLDYTKQTYSSIFSSVFAPLANTCDIFKSYSILLWITSNDLLHIEDWSEIRQSK